MQSGLYYCAYNLTLYFSVQPAKPAANTEPSFDSLFSVGGFETSGPGWDNPPAPHAPVAPHAPAPSGNGRFKT